VTTVAPLSSDLGTPRELQPRRLRARGNELGLDAYENVRQLESRAVTKGSGVPTIGKARATLGGVVGGRSERESFTCRGFADGSRP